MNTKSKSLKNMARPEGFEPPTLCLEGRRSFQLSYGRVVCNCLSLRLLSHSSQRAIERHLSSRDENKSCRRKRAPLH
jgi:hypothetical protein